jgi:hypothetical protein
VVDSIVTRLLDTYIGDVVVATETMVVPRFAARADVSPSLQTLRLGMLLSIAVFACSESKTPKATSR